MFPVTPQEIQKRLEAVDPVQYSRTRNFTDGSVTQLSPYISRGVLSPKSILMFLRERYSWSEASKLVQELAWREYWQRVWQTNGERINGDLLRPQEDVRKHGVPVAILSAKTGIAGIDSGINELTGKGYVHNHVRMYLASLACNFARCHWREPARWMYYHLLDGDWGSNALSWQWVAGTNSSKRYYMNQENVNRYCHTAQSGTFLDSSYAELPIKPVPDQLFEVSSPSLITSLPKTPVPELNPDLPLILYNYYNLCFNWRSELRANRVLLLEPSVFERYPVSRESLDFATRLAANIPGIIVFTGEFSEIRNVYEGSKVFYREHPLNTAYDGEEDGRDWMFSFDSAPSSFSSFWRKAQPQAEAMFD